MSTALKEKAANDEEKAAKPITVRSQEIVIALVGYAGAGCSEIAGAIMTELDSQGYKEPKRIKLSGLIIDYCKDIVFPKEEEEPNKGKSKFSRARMLQNQGDILRTEKGSMVLSALAIDKIQKLRDGAEAGKTKKAFILDSIKHFDEVDLLRQVYGKSFYLLAIHCDKDMRKKRLIGDNKKNKGKFKGVTDKEIEIFLNRDEKDGKNSAGQQVIKAFHHADYFIDNNQELIGSVGDDIKRFINLVLGSDLVRPKLHETGMYFAHNAARRSSCLSRQVGASLQAMDGTVIATGANEVPVYGGGICGEDEAKKPNNRCFLWEIELEDKTSFVGCHNSRKKNDLRLKIGKWIGDTFSEKIAHELHPVPEKGFDTGKEQRDNTASKIGSFFNSITDEFDKMPGVTDAIEYSRSIHAEMNTLFNAAANGFSPVGAALFTTTFPCHNCARHLVTAGIKEVYYIEPYVKSLALELHSDAISADKADNKNDGKMLILPYTGIGPSIYSSHFVKRGEIKNEKTGEYLPEDGIIPHYSIRLENLDEIEKKAIELLGDR